MNKLAFETSPYLLQHKDNPVDWFPWSNEAFEEAKSRDVPIFLSIGYSTCHWCHVMEKECFEDKEVAELMNQNFVNIKVDREERPDIDGIYMNIVQMMTGSGGWPMTVLLNHEQKPFFSGTFFPKQSKYGRIGMVDLIPKIREAWLESRNEVNESADKITSSLNSTLKSNEEEKSQLDSSIFDRIFNNFTKTFDHQYGGFGGKPKFPTPHNLLFLLNYYKLTKNNSALEMVETTLLKMRYGGIFDQIGFGFHRYATDNTWTVPHFEKMLYDNALLLMVYGEAFRITKNEFFKNVCNEIFEYIKRVMISPDGLFYSAEDADSEGEEGKYYIWKISELKEILGNDFCEFAEIYSIKAEGNFLDESTRELNSQNILFVNEKFHKSNSTNLISIENRLKLLGIREKRIKPLKDTKILTDWNGLMIYSLVTTSQNINNSELLEIAEKTAQVILKKNFKKGYLVHIDKGENSILGFIDDYGYLGLALNSLYLATMKEDYLAKSNKIAGLLLDNFYDRTNGGFFQSSDKGEKLISRQKELYDGAIPSGNSVTLLLLTQLFQIDGDYKYYEAIVKSLDYFSAQITLHPHIFTFLTNSISFIVGSSREIVFVEVESDIESNDKLKIIRENKGFNDILIIITKISSNISDNYNSFKSIGDKSTVYFCSNFKCEKPVNEIKEIKDILI